MQVKERPIIFSSPMVRAILEGRKTMTRRVIKELDGSAWETSLLESGRWREAIKSPYEIGMSLWVRETWQEFAPDEIPNGRFSMKGRSGIPGPPEIIFRAIYCADGEISDHIEYGKARWRPSIHMPRWASRITLEITNVKVERLTDITVEDAQREGVTPLGQEGDGRRWRAAFHETWDSIYGKDAWDKNLWVWCISFRRTV